MLGTSVQSLLLLAAILTALIAKNPPQVKTYFWVQFISTLFSEFVLLVYGWQSNQFRVAYCLVTAAILTASWKIVWPRRRRMALVTFDAIVLLIIAFNHLPPVRSVDTVILLMAGVMTVFLGLALALQMMDNLSLYGPLAILWLVLGGFSVIHAIEPTPFWDGLADWFTYFAVMSCFLWIGVGRKFCIVKKSSIIPIAYSLGKK